MAADSAAEDGSWANMTMEEVKIRVNDEDFGTGSVTVEKEALSIAVEGKRIVSIPHKRLAMVATSTDKSLSPNPCVYVQCTDEDEPEGTDKSDDALKVTSMCLAPFRGTDETGTLYSALSERAEACAPVSSSEDGAMSDFMAMLQLMQQAAAAKSGMIPDASGQAEGDDDIPAGSIE